MKRYLLLALCLVPVPSWACDHVTRLYNTAATIDFCLWNTTGTALADSITISAGEVKVSQDEGAEANCTTGTGACVTDRGSCYSLALAAAELDTARTYVTIIDASALPHCILVETYGNASAQHGVPSVSVSQWNGTAVASPDTAGYPVVTVKDGTGQGEINTSSGNVTASGSGERRE